MLRFFQFSIPFTDRCLLIKTTLPISIVEETAINEVIRWHSIKQKLKNLDQNLQRNRDFDKGITYSTKNELEQTIKGYENNSVQFIIDRLNANYGSKISISVCLRERD